MELFRKRGRDLDFDRAVAAAGLEQQDPHRRVLRQPVGERAARRAGADDHIVMQRRHPQARRARRGIRARHELEVLDIEDARRGDVLAHVSGPVRDDAPVLKPVPGRAALPRGAGEARLQRVVEALLDLRSHVERSGAGGADMAEGLGDVRRLRLEVHEDRAARGVRVGTVHQEHARKAGNRHAEVRARRGSPGLVERPAIRPGDPNRQHEVVRAKAGRPDDAVDLVQLPVGRDDALRPGPA